MKSISLSKLYRTAARKRQQTAAKSARIVQKNERRVLVNSRSSPRVIFFACAGIVSVLAACAKQRRTLDIESPQQMRIQIERAVPCGTPLNKAHETMCQRGFDCEFVQRGRWREQRGLNFLRCVRDDGQLIKRRWDVAIMHNGERVTSVDLRAALVYP
jgi:hypothetical protein